MPADGAFEHVHTVNRLIQKTREKGSERCIAWLDVSNAFVAVPHSALTAALRAMGAGSVLADIVREAYEGTSSRIAVDTGTSQPVDVRSGIKKSCPLSGLLFNCAIDTAVRAIQGDESEHRVLAFAGDLCYC